MIEQLENVVFPNYRNSNIKWGRVFWKIENLWERNIIVRVDDGETARGKREWVTNGKEKKNGKRERRRRAARATDEGRRRGLWWWRGGGGGVGWWGASEEAVYCKTGHGGALCRFAAVAVRNLPERFLLRVGSSAVADTRTHASVP